MSGDPDEPSDAGLTGSEGPTSWDDYQRHSNDLRERRATYLQAMSLRAQLGMEHEQRQRRYRRFRLVAVLAWSVIMVGYASGLIAWFTSPQDNGTLGLALWAGTMTVVCLSYATVVVLRSLHPGRAPVAPLPDGKPRHPAFVHRDSPGPLPWQRRHPPSA